MFPRPADRGATEKDWVFSWVKPALPYSTGFTRKALRSEMLKHLYSFIAGNPYSTLLRTVWSYLDGRRTLFIISYALFAIGHGIRMFEPLLLGRALNIIQEGGEDMLSRVTLILGIYASISLVFWIFHGTARLIERMNAFHVRWKAIDALFMALNELPLKWHRSNHTGETTSKVHRAAGAVSRFAERGFEYVHTFIKLVFSVIAIISFLPLYGSIALIVGAGMLLIAMRFDRVLARLRKRIINREHRVASALLDYLGNITTVVSLRLGKAARSELTRRMLRVKPEHWKHTYVNEAKWFICSMIVSALTFAMLLFYVRQQVALTGTVMVGSLMALYQYIGALADTFFRMAGQFDELVWSRMDVESAAPILEAHGRLNPVPIRTSLASDWVTIEVSDVRFTYEDGRHRRQHLDDAFVRLTRGRKIALIGESGSGKSTFMSLLRGLEQPENAKVAVDGVPAVGLSVLSDAATLIPQQPELFENTIRYNLTTGFAATNEEIRHACDLARFSPVLERIPRGLKAHIQEKGVNLSGGEKQRLALARGVLAARESSLILMDEPTSSVDALNELAIYQSIFGHFADRCIVSSVHRLHLLPLFDEVVVMRAGRIAETGTFADLLGRPDGILRALWERSVTDKGEDWHATTTVDVSRADDAVAAPAHKPAAVIAAVGS